MQEQTEQQEEEELIEQDEEVEKYKILAEERLSQLKYLQADFDNYRKNFEKEKIAIIKLANENLVKELIVILDDFESSLKLIKENKEGVSLIHKKFLETLQKNGLKQIDAMGKKFDPHFHEALCFELSEHNENEIIEEIQKGYTFCSKLIRPTKVKINKYQQTLNTENQEQHLNTEKIEN